MYRLDLLQDIHNKNHSRKRGDGATLPIENRDFKRGLGVG